LSTVKHDQYFLDTLAALILITKQLSINSLGRLLNIGTDEMVVRLVKIQSLIKIPANNDGIVQLNHMSFRDFLLDKKRSKEYFICPAEYHAVVVIHCLVLMGLKHGLKMMLRVGMHVASGSTTWIMPSRRTCWADIIKNLDIFLKSDGLEVWINTVIRNVCKQGKIKKRIDNIQKGISNGNIS
jgi:hypothetical protein